ncbi:hypothetical protein OS493_038227 [Desmophyllum pertusum]|uniref:Uncharacterized protein n=1 Tax=Desmophyllum pertusum TaxID=174260 RepID=A0A9W9ZV84_9CNID|nr:hypothetical protein OS493_038227 [Desmophyllum pertusum]
MLGRVLLGSRQVCVYVCQECDDYQEQCIVCIAYSLEHFLVRGPQKLLEYNKPQCLFDNCYGCFDPLIKDRCAQLNWTVEQKRLTQRDGKIITKKYHVNLF